MRQRVIYLVRHGHAAYADTEPKDWDGYLTEVGQQQAQLTAQRLSQLPITAIHHSNAGRAVETAQILAAAFPHIPLQPTPLLRECIPSIPMRGWFTEIPPERLQESKTQVEQAFAQFFQPPDDHDESEHHDVLVCHGNIICYFICRTLQVSVDAWNNTLIHNCGISEVRVNDKGNLRLISHNDTGHLPHEMRTFL